MIKVNCKTETTVKLHDLVPFQGNLKKRTPKDIEALKTSLKEEGMMMPFALWVKDDKNYLLDGHGRMEALIRLSMEDPTVLEEDFPCLIVEAEDEDTARKALLQITSSYGHIDKKGLVTFTCTIPDYKAPVIQRTLGVRKRKVEGSEEVSAMRRVTLQIPSDKYNDVMQILSTVPFITVLK